MNYTIAGQDGKLYGPAGAEQIRQWIAQGRVDSRTPVFPEGAREWTYAGLVPELALQSSATPPTMTPLTGSAGVPVTNNFAVWGMVCGLVSWVCCCCGLPLSLLGIIFSILGLVQVNANPQTQQGRGMAIAGLVLCGLNLVWCVVGTVLNLALNAQPDMINFNSNFN
jgi:hypothetical protein